MGAENLNCNMSPNNSVTVPDGTFLAPPLEESDIQEEHLPDVEFNGLHDVYVGGWANGESELALRFVTSGGTIEILAEPDAMLRLAELIEEVAIKAKSA